MSDRKSIIMGPLLKITSLFIVQIEVFLSLTPSKNLIVEIEIGIAFFPALEIREGLLRCFNGIEIVQELYRL